MNNKEQAFSKLVRENKSTIYTVCYMFSKDQDEVADLFQEILIRLWQGYATFEGRSDIKTWIYRVSLNTCISIDRKKKRKGKSVPLAIDKEENEDAAWRKQIRQLHGRITRLQPFDRAIVLLWLEDLSYEEIASIVGISVKNVSVLLYRIREQLKNMSNE